MFDIQNKYQPTPKSLVAVTTDQISANVYNAGAPVKLFEGFSHHAPRLFVSGKTTAGAVTQVRVRLVGSSAAALNANLVVIADSGLGDAMANGTVFHKELVCVGQATARQYYGLLFDTAGAAGTADVVGGVKMAPQSNMVYPKAAVP